MTKTRNKKTVISLLLAAMLTVAVIGGSLAYLSATTADTTNTFTFVSGDDGAKIEIEEPSWSAASASNLTPGIEVPKDPQINNIGTLDMWVAMQITFTKGDGTTLTAAEYTRLAGMLDIDYNTTNWTAAATAGPVTIYDYNTKLAGTTGETQALFNSVTIKSTLSNDDIDWLTTTLGGFNIVVKGAGLQDYDGATAAGVRTELNGLFT